MVDEQTARVAIQALGTALGEMMEDAAPEALTLGQAPKQASLLGLMRTAEDIAVLGRAIEVLGRRRG